MTTELGFGCASLGSRISRREGIGALVRAFDQGITWFDLAPSYGDGQCEAIFAEFARPRRDRIRICTKVGIAPPRVAAWKAALKPVARSAIRLAPGLRKLVARGRAGPNAEPITGELIARSLDDSLRRLGTEFVDVLALHNPSTQDLGRADLAEALERALSSGRARAIGIAGAFDAARIAITIGLPVGHVQFASGQNHDPTEIHGVTTSTGAVAPLVVTHSVLGQGLHASGCGGKFSEPAAISALLEEAGYPGGGEAAWSAARVEVALTLNPSGIVLMSMFDAAHLAENVGTWRNFNVRRVTRLLAALGERGYRITAAA